jgi:hypothetical protein
MLSASDQLLLLILAAAVLSPAQKSTKPGYRATVLRVLTSTRLTVSGDVSVGSLADFSNGVIEVAMPPAQHT